MGVNRPGEQGQCVGLVVIRWSKAFSTHGRDDIVLAGIALPGGVALIVPTGTP